MKKKNKSNLIVVLSVLLGAFIISTIILVFAIVTIEKDQCVEMVDGDSVIEKSEENGTLLSTDDPNVIELFGLAHGPFGMGDDWAMFKPGKTLVKDMSYNYKLYLASSIYGKFVNEITYPNSYDYRMELREEFVKNAVDLTFGTGVYQKTDYVPYLCGSLFWDNTNKIYFSDNLGCGGRLGSSHNEEIIKAEKFSDRIEITSAVGFTTIDGAIYKDSEFKEVADERINASNDVVKEIIKTNPEKFYNYKYTFKLNNSGFYNYYSIERVN